MIKQRALIGMELDCTERVIETSQLQRITRVLHHANSPVKNPNPDAIGFEPYQFLPAFLLGNLINLSSIYRALDININNILLSRDSITNHINLKDGDRVIVRTFLKDAYEQQASSNPIGFIFLESVGSANDCAAFHCERVLAIRGGFQRGHRL